MFSDSDGGENARIYGDVRADATVQCNDRNNCTGFFEYSPPDRSPNATQLQLQEVAAYSYGNDKELFFPNHTHPSVQECVSQWDGESEKWRERGMSTYREDMTIFQSFFSNESYANSSRHFYMEIGANDGVRESNSRFFDLCLGWAGLLVEPHPDNYKRMERLRPNAHHLGVAPSCDTTGGQVKFPAHRYTNAVANEEGATLDIHCGPLSYYLDQIGIDHIDFWSLDVEGSELNILRTVDFDKVAIDVILAESANRLPEKQHLADEVRAYLQQRGYLLLASVSALTRWCVMSGMYGTCRDT